MERPGLRGHGRGSQRRPPPADEETNPFCKMYDGIVAEADRMTVDEYFAKRYVVTGDTMTTYMDMDLMQDTEYMYRVKRR